MRKLLLACALSLGLVACAQTGVPTSPSQVANQTTLDEKPAILAETAFTAAARGAALYIRVRDIRDPATLTRIENLRQKAETAVKAVRRAYDTANAASYQAALASATPAVLALTNAIAGDN